MSRGIEACRGDARSLKRADRLVSQSVMKGRGLGRRRYRFEDSGTGADDICTTEFFGSNVEHAL